MPKVGVSTIQSLTVALTREKFSHALRIATWIFEALHPRMKADAKPICILKEGVEAELGITFRHGEYSRLMKYLCRKRILIQEFSLSGWNPNFTYGPGLRVMKVVEAYVPNKRWELLKQRDHHTALLSAVCAKLGIPADAPDFTALQNYLLPPT